MRVSRPPTLPAALAALVPLIVAVVILAVPSAAAAETAQNAAGRYDGLVLRDLGGKQAALVQLVAEGGAFTPRELWRSKKGAFDVRKATFVAGDVNGDGIGDGIVLYDLGRSRSRLYVYLSDGVRSVQATAWTSKAGAFAKGRAKLAVTDLNGDGRDDVIALYDRGHSSAALYRFVSTGTKFQQTTGWSARRGAFSCARAQLAAGDVTGDGRGDAIVLYRSTTTSSRLYVFVAGASKFTKKTFWSGKYAAGRAKLAAGDADSDGDYDAICLYRKPDNTGRLDVFLSSKKSFAKPAVWYDGAGGPLPATSCRFAVGDVTGDGRADAVVAQPTGDMSSSVTTCVSTGSGFEPQVWWDGDWIYPTLRLGVAPSPGLVVSDDAEVLDNASMRYLRKVETDGTLTFAGETGQLSRLKAGDVLLAGASDTFPTGLCRTVTAVGEQSGKVVVTTTQAALADVIDQGEVAFSKRITLDDLSADGALAPGVRLKRDLAPPGTLPVALGGSSAEGFGFDLSTTIAGKVEIEGSVWLDPSAYVDWEIGWTGVKSASYTQTMTTTTDLSVSLKGSIIPEEKIETTLVKRTLAVITIMVGPVPVVVTPEFEVYVGAKGSADAGVTAGVTIATDASIRIAYDDDDGWSHTETCSVDLTPHAPQLFAGLTVRGYAGAGLAFKIYAVAGPTAKLEAYTELAAKTTDKPWWKLTAGLEAKIGFEVEALDITLLEIGFDIPLVGPVVIDQAGSDTSGGGPSDYHSPSVKGKILAAADASPLHGARVEVYAGAGPPSGEALFLTGAAADGTYVFSGLSPGQYTVLAWDDWYAENWRTVTVNEGSITTGQNVLLTATSQQGVSGRVVQEPGGAGMDGVYVGIHAGSGTDWVFSDDSRYTSGGGTYEFSGLTPGQYEISAIETGCFSQRAGFTVVAGQKTIMPDLRLVPYESQGVYGRVVADLSGDPIAGATVELHAGTDAPAGYLRRDWHSGVDGSFGFTGLDAGPYTLVVTQPGYLTEIRNVEVTRATITDLGEVVLKEPGGQSMRSSLDGCIRWTEGTYGPNGTYEFWFRPVGDLGGVEYGSVLAQISRDYPDWMGDGPHRWPIMSVNYRSSAADPADTVLAFGINENKGDESGAWHFVVGTTPVEVGHWYHVAAVYGSYGMKLFVNGHQEGWEDYTGAPEPNQGVAAGGWFSLGDNHTLGSGYMTAYGDYRGLCVADSQRYDGDFTPLDWPLGGWDTLIYDELIDITNGENVGFVPTP